MKLIIMGMKHNTTEQYMALDVESRRNENTLLEVGKEVVLKTLAPFPFQTFNGITFDRREELLDNWSPCYLWVDGQISKDEFDSMDGSGIVYYHFLDRKVTLIEEAKDFIQYTKRIDDTHPGFRDWDFNHYIVNGPYHSDDEIEASKQIISKRLSKKPTIRNKKNPSRSDYSRIQDATYDLSLKQGIQPLLSWLLDKSLEGFLISFDRWGSSDLTNKAIDSTELTNDQYWELMRLTGYKYVESKYFTNESYQALKATGFEVGTIGSAIYEDRLEVLKERGIDINSIFMDLFNSKKDYILESLNWTYKEDEHERPDATSFEEIFADESYQGQLRHHSPYDYYCCEDCDGYNIHDLYSDEELAGYDEYVDQRLDEVLDPFQDWFPYLSDSTLAVFDFIPTELLEHKDYSWAKEALKRP